MFSLTLKLNRKILILLSLFLALSLVFAASFFIFRPDTPQISGENASDRQTFLNNLGYKCDIDCENHNETVIPSEFNDVYEKYNSLQRSSGFDLGNYKGRTVERYTIPIISDEENIYATVLVCDGKIIGGDIHSTEQNGFMKGF